MFSWCCPGAFSQAPGRSWCSLVQDQARPGRLLVGSWSLLVGVLALSWSVLVAVLVYPGAWSWCPWGTSAFSQGLRTRFVRGST